MQSFFPALTIPCVPFFSPTGFPSRSACQPSLNGDFLTVRHCSAKDHEEQ